MWNGFSMISKQPELTAGILETLLEAEQTLQAAPGTAHHTTRCVSLLPCFSSYLNSTFTIAFEFSRLHNPADIIYRSLGSIPKQGGDL